MKRIVFYVKHLAMLPAWIDPIAPFLTDDGYEIVVLHASTLNRDTAGDPPAELPPYTCIEIGDKSMANIVGLLEELRPLAVVMFTFRSLFDLLLVRVTKHLRLPTLYIQHGFYVSTKFQMADKRASFRRYRRFARWYLYFLLRVAPRRLLRELWVLYRGMFKIDYTPTRFDYALFYSAGGLKDAQPYFKFDDAQAYFSGYPLVNDSKDLEHLLERSRTHKTQRVVYIHQPFILDRFTHIDHDQEFAFLNNVAAICERHGYEFVMKIHPRESPERYASGLRHGSAVIDTSTSMTDVLTDCSVVIGHFSTALFTGILLEKPIIVMDYPGLADRYYSLFEPVALRIHTESQLEHVLSNGQLGERRPAEYRDFMIEHIGQHNTCEHRAHTIAEIVEKAALGSSIPTGAHSK